MPVDPEVVEMTRTLKELGVRPITEMDHEEARKEDYRTTVPFMSQPQTVGRIENRELECSSGKLSIRIYWPREVHASPLVVFFHGGGWVLGDLNMADETCCMLANEANAIVVSAAYRLAPEYKFPAAPEDCYEAAVWAYRNAKDLGGDQNRIAVCGDSAGGNLAAVTCLLARDRGKARITYQALVYPVTDLSRDMSKFSAVEYGPSEADIQWFVSRYLSRPSDAVNPLASPLLGNLRGLPKATLITAGNDSLREQCVEYARKLEESGVDANVINYEGQIHGFFTLPGYFKAGRDAIKKIAMELRR